MTASKPRPLPRREKCYPLNGAWFLERHSLLEVEPQHSWRWAFVLYPLSAVMSVWMWLRESG